MSELKTYKCDICSNIYYSDEAEATFSIIHERELLIGKGSRTYDHVCPDCLVNINKMLDNPTIIDDLIAKKNEFVKRVDKLESAIKYINRKIVGWRAVSIGLIGAIIGNIIYVIL